MVKYRLYDIHNGEWFDNSEVSAEDARAYLRRIINGEYGDKELLERYQAGDFFYANVEDEEDFIELNDVK